VIELLRDASGNGQTIVMVTHDESVAAAADAVIHMADGVLRTPARDAWVVR
jgi:ABC-type lipoprotein export system ATPase subunit